MMEINSQQTIRVAVNPDYPMIMDGIARLLSLYPEFSMINWSYQHNILNGIRQNHPDILLFDSTANDLTLVKRIRAVAQNTRLLVWYTTTTDTVALRMIQAGVDGLISLKSTPDGLITALRTVHQGTLYLPESIKQLSALQYLRPQINSTIEQLSDRELQVASALAEGASKQEIGHQLCISSKTVYAHRAAILRKLKLRNDADIVRFAMHEGLVVA